VDLHVPERRFSILPLSDALIDQAPFLDTRLDIPFLRAALVPYTRIPAQLPHGPVGWLFHTSFCASTLLARALHLPPYTVALKEPFILRRLADARKSNWSVDGLLEASVRLLARPFHPEGAVVIKPTHVALNIAAALMAATPHSKAIILTSSLDDFLLSNLKNTAESQAKIPQLVERAIKATRFGLHLSASAVLPPDLVCAAGLQWAAQRELMVDVIAAIGAHRIRALTMTELLADVAAGVARCAEWLQLPVPIGPLAAHAQHISMRHAKSLDLPFSPEHRARESELAAHRHGKVLAEARAWLDGHILPAMRAEALHEPRWA